MDVPITSVSAGRTTEKNHLAIEKATVQSPLVDSQGNNRTGLQSNIGTIHTVSTEFNLYILRFVHGVLENYTHKRMQFCELFLTSVILS
jgi:hypothetical protein